MRAFVPPILTAAMSLTACLEGYRAPPLVDLEAPETGTYFVGDDLHLSFDGPVSPESLTIRVFADVRDFEGQLPAGTAPLLAACTVSNAPCGETGFKLDPDHLGATITFAGNLPGVTQTMPLAVYTALESDRDVAIALSVLLLALSVTVLVALRGHYLRAARP